MNSPVLPPRKQSSNWPVILGVLLVIGLVAALLPVFKCSRQDCYVQVQENRRCLKIARNGSYPPNVARHYEEVLDHWPCDECHGHGRITFAYGVWLLLKSPLLRHQ